MTGVLIGRGHGDLWTRGGAVWTCTYDWLMTRQESGHHEPRSEAAGVPKRAGPWISDFQPPELRENRFLCFQMPQPVVSCPTGPSRLTQLLRGDPPGISSFPSAFLHLVQPSPEFFMWLHFLFSYLPLPLGRASLQGRDYVLINLCFQHLAL